jgi:DNA-binding transcriptional MerR regulator
MKPLTIGQLARRCGVSRTALLNYERLGLIAAARTEAGYRLYDAQAVAHVEQIRAYRATGIGLDAIATLLQGGDQATLIERRLHDIHREIAQLREQQGVLLQLLRAGAATGVSLGLVVGEPAMNKERWTSMLRAAGLDDSAMERWHALFEHQSPQAHEDFLRSLGLLTDEIERIRRWSREALL